MAIFKCKMCGGNLETTEGSSVGICEYCGTKQTVPTANDENLQGLYNRANTLRIKSEFDKAEQLYEKILQADGNQAEAYWGLILCKYGIEYVEDPATFKRIPTCHRASYDSIIADDDYKSALKYADDSQRNIYEQEAKEIDRIQKEIIELSSKEEPYDVFICYKETDDTGSRTQDSVIANDIYYQLTQEGFKVFYAAITLEDKLGSAYEPCIFAALNSAKVMLAIGTKPEYFNAVWVKNEWSRYLKIMKKDRSKMLIPCYKDMDAYDLPDEFAHLQAQDMGKIGFINDVVRGIKKVVSKENTKSAPVVNVVSNTTTEPLLKRAFIFLEDGDWNSANEYCEKVLDIDPECAKAYLGKLMAELHIKKQEYLQNLNETFENNSNYSKVIRYATPELAGEIKSYIEHINTRNKHQAEELEKEQKYNKALEYFNTNDVAQIKNAIAIFNSLSGYKDSDEKVFACNAKIEEIEVLQEKRKLEEERKIEQERILNEIRKKRNKKIATIVTPIIAVVIASVILLTTVIIPNSQYNKAVALMESEQFDEAYNLFVELGDYKEAKQFSKEIAYKKGTQLMDSDINSAALWFERAEDYQDSKEKLNTLFSLISKRFQRKIDVGCYYAAGVSSSGKLYFSGSAIAESVENEIKKWDNIVAVAGGDWCIAGLKSDGTVVAAGDNGIAALVDDWKYIVSIAAGNSAVAGLKMNGTVVCSDPEINKSVSKWNDIIAIDMESDYILGLKKDGTVVVSNYITIPSDWKDIVQIAAGSQHCVALRADGTVLVVGDGVSGSDAGLSVGGWKDICSIAAGEFTTYGVKKDGTVVSTGMHSDIGVNSWTNVDSIVANYLEVACIHKDGTVSWIAHGQQPGDNEKWDLLK